jgi:hypothetical protein
MKNDSLYEFVHVSLAYSEDEANITDTQLFYTLEDALEYYELKKSTVYDEYIEHINDLREDELEDETESFDVRDLMSDPEYSESEYKWHESHTERKCRRRFSCLYTSYGSDELVIYEKNVMKFV